MLRNPELKMVDMCRMQVFLLTLLALLFSNLVWADQNEWPPMPSLDSLVGDTSGAIVIKDSTLIPGFGIYRAASSGETIYIDTSTFSKYGLVVFFDPWQQSSLKFVRAMGKFKKEFKEKWGFEVRLVACKMAVISCRKSNHRKPTWLCQVFLMPHFSAYSVSADSLKRVLYEIDQNFPVYCLRQPLHFEYAGSNHFTPILLTAKDKFVFSIETTPVKAIPNFLDKEVFWRLAFSALSRSMESRDFKPLEGGDKK